MMKTQSNKSFNILTKLVVALIAVIGLIAVATPAFAQGGSNPLSVTVDRNSLTTDETLTLKIDVTTDGRQHVQPIVPALDGFNVVGQSSSTQSTIVNGVGSYRVVYDIRLQPSRAGSLTIPAISVDLDGTIIRSEPIAVEVEQGTGQVGTPSQAVSPPSELNGQNFYIEAEVDNETPYLGEQIQYIFRFYYAEGPSRSPQLGPPEFTGFWNEHESTQTNYNTTVDGRSYRVAEIRTTLFPALAGELAIDPTTLTIPGGFFSRGETLQTWPVTVNVQPLPQGAPDSFHGAVGQFGLESGVDMLETKVDEPVTYQVAISGAGNVSTMGDPEWTPGDAWRAFEPEVATETTLDNNVVTGQRMFEQTLIPTEPGELILPTLEYSYFDPNSAEYHTLSADSITIIVTGEPELPVVIGQNDMPAPDAPVDTDTIRGIDPSATALSQANEPISKSVLFAAALAIPVVALGAQAGVQYRSNYLASNNAAYRSKHAAKNAHKALATAQTEGADLSAASSKTLGDYLAAKLDQPVAGMTQAGIGVALAAYGVSAESIERIKNVFTLSENSRFAPGNATGNADTQLLHETDSLIDTLEGEW
jgi:hypothetical protein